MGNKKETDQSMNELIAWLQKQLDEAPAELVFIDIKDVIKKAKKIIRQKLPPNS
jgi:hypothetical protein